LQEWFSTHPALLLLRPGEDFTGRKFVLAEQRPRMQLRHGFVPLTQGPPRCFQFTTGRCLPAWVCRVDLRHGFSRLLSCHRHTVDLIFYDTK